MEPLTDAQIRTVELLNVLPGVRIDEIRAAAGLGSSGDPWVDEMIINLPWDIDQRGD